MIMRSSASLLALLVAAAACTPSPGPPRPAAQDPPPVVSLGSGVALAPVSAAATTPLPKKPPPYAPCVAKMFDHPPGHQGLFAFENPAGLNGYRDADWNVVIPPRYRFAYSFSPEGVAAVYDDDGPAFIDPSGKLLARAFLYDNGPDYFTEGLARVVQDGKVGFINPHGQITIEPRFAYASAFCHGRAAVCNQCRRGNAPHGVMEGGPWGFIDRQGRIVVPMKFDKVSPFDDNRAEAVLDGKPVTIDPQGQVVER
ncbi:MAG: WG repeat-containing protein [Deltaproteobacteria bacterium]|nr:WG repeat-containing protein [Deltaproteobacteria bacterium]